MSAAHTPGPWQVMALSDCLSFSVGTAGTSRRTGVTVAFVHPEDDHHEALREAEANARLIAAAPELLAQLENTLAAFDRLCELLELGTFDAAEDFVTNHAADILDDARAALAKVQS